MDCHHFRFPTNIYLGDSVILRLPEFLKGRNVKRPLLVIDHGIKDLPQIAEIKKHLTQEGFPVLVYDGSKGNPTLKQVAEGLSAYKREKADSLVLLGGGCAVDVGKAIAVMTNHPGDLFDYEDGKVDARPIFAEKLPFMIACPTTSGTGSEVGGSTVISDDETHTKKIIWAPCLIPPVVLADPELTMTLPGTITRAVGFDALSHNLEAFLAKNVHPICDGIAMQGIRLIFKSLETAYRKPNDRSARKDMLLASMMGAIAFQKGLGVTHSCAHALSTVYDTHHGLANAMMMIPSMEFNKSRVLERFATLSNFLEFTGNTLEEKASRFIQKLRDLHKALEFPQNLSELGYTYSEKLAEIAIKDPCHDNNPVPVTQSDFVRLFKQAFEASR